MNNHSEVNLQEIAKKESILRKILSRICFTAAGIITFCILIDLFSFSEIGYLIFIFIGIALIFEQLSRKAMIIKNSEDAVDQRAIFNTSKKKTVPKILNEIFDQNMTVTDEKNFFINEINRANNLISDQQITNNLREIRANVIDIFNAASKDEIIEKQIRKFSSIYLPMTLKLLNKYIEYNNKKIQTKNVKELKTKLANMIGKIKYAFCRLNDNIIELTSMDVEAEIKALESILAIDGLSPDTLQMPIIK